FFFQSEDGIRDGHVTGVQTCALPISGHGVSDTGSSDISGGCGGLPGSVSLSTSRTWSASWIADSAASVGSFIFFGVFAMSVVARSEERCVGELCRCVLE